VGSGATTISVIGTGFIPATTVSFNSKVLTTTYITGTSLSAIIPQANEAAIGKYSIASSNPTPGGGTSSSVEFDVTGGVLNVNITDLPSGTPANITLTGSGGYTTAITQNASLQVPVGSYTLTANSVSVGTDTYSALAPTQSLAIAGFSTNTVTVDYKNVVPATTKVLDSVALSSLSVASDGTTLTMSSSSPIAQSLEAGDVVVVPPTSPGGVAPGGPAPLGMLQKVTSVSSGNSQIVVYTQQATLADAFKRLSFQLPAQLSSQSIRSVKTANGVVFHPGSKIQNSTDKTHIASHDQSLTDPCGNSSLGIFDITDPVSEEIVQGLTLSGQLELCAGLNLNVDLVGTGFLGLQPQLNSATATAMLGEYSDIAVQGTFLEGSFNNKITLATLDFAPIVVPGLPIWVTPEVSVFYGANGSLSSGFSTEVSTAGTFTRGVSYTSGAWVPVTQPTSLQFSYQPPTLDASLNAKAYAGIALNLYLYDVAGPSFTPDGYLLFNADITQNPWWTLNGGLEGPMSFDVTIFGEEDVASYNLGSLFNYEHLIASAPGPFLPTVSVPVITTISPQQITAGASSFDLIVNGSNFIPGDVVNFGATPLSANWQSASQISATVPNTQVATPETVQVAVTNLNVSSATSNSVNFVVVSGTGKVSISPTSVYVPEGEVQTFAATVSGSDGVNWSIQEGASGGTISNAGIYTAPSSTGIYHVIATSMADSTQSAVATVNVVIGPTITTLHSFNSTVEGANPMASLIQGGDGNYYGTTLAGGNLSCTLDPNYSGCGTIYKMDAVGNVTTLHSFTGLDGLYPGGHLTQLSNGSLYGTTSYGGNSFQVCSDGLGIPSGCGTIFEIYTDGSGFNSVYQFNSFTSPVGVGPDASLFLASNGNLYGTTLEGGMNNTCGGVVNNISISNLGCGNIFRLDSSNTLYPILNFTGPNGAYPFSGLLQLSDGNLYGVTAAGGNLTCSSYASPGCGIVFKTTTAGDISTLYSFSQQDGASPIGSLVQGSDGNLYGVTTFGGNVSCNGGAQWQGCGTVYKISTAGTLQLLHNFSGPDGAYPVARLIQASDGYFYGTTSGGGDASCTGRFGPGCGTVFRMDAAGNVTTLYAFTGQSDGSWPEAALILGANGNLYGTTAYGGANDDGVVFLVSNLSTLSSSSSQAKSVGQKQNSVTKITVHHTHVAPPVLSFPAAHIAKNAN
jgi:uncharacterized repeat protein (TIGR03803 family)